MSGPPAEDQSEPSAVDAAPKRGWGRIAVAAGLALILALGAFILFNRGSGTGSAYALQFSKAHAGDTYRYHMTMAMDMTMSAKELGGSQPLRATTDMVMTFRVDSVDSDGVAMVDFSTSNGTVESNGAKQSVPDSHITMRIAPDGHVVSINGNPLSPRVPLNGGFLGDQLTPILPPHQVKPGDTWSKDYQVPFPFGGSVKYSSDNRFLRYETLDGARAAVIRSEVAAPMDSDLNFSALAALFGRSSGDLPPGWNDVKMHLGGRLSSIGTSWVDLTTGRWFKTQSTGLVDMEIRVENLPLETAGVTEDTILVAGKVDVTIENLGEVSSATV
jgi:hypothetical protein